MNEDKTHQEFISDAQNELTTFINVYSGNTELLNRIFFYFNKMGGFESKKKRLKEGVTINNLKEITSLRLLNETFEVCQIIYLFHDQPLKVIEYINRFLKQWETSLAELFLELISIAINDERRFDFDSSGLTYIKENLKQINIESNRKGDAVISVNSWIKFFKGENETKFPIDPYIKSFLQVRGILKSNSEIVNDFIRENYDRIYKGDNLREQNINSEDLPSINPLKENQKVMLLYELGIFDYLTKEFDLKDNYVKLAQIVESFSGIKQDTIRQTYRAIKGVSHSEKNDPYINSKNEDFIINSFQQFGISRKVKKGKT